MVAATFNTAAFAAKPRGLITVTATYTGGKINEYTLLPAGPGLSSAKVSGNILTFQVQAPRKIEIRVNEAVTTVGDVLTTPSMYLIVDLPEVASEVPRPGDKGVQYFGPGTHDVGVITYSASNPPPKLIYIVTFSDVFGPSKDD